MLKAWKPVGLILIIATAAGLLTALLTSLLAPRSSKPRADSPGHRIIEISPRQASPAPAPRTPAPDRTAPAAPALEPARTIYAPSRATELARRSKLDAAALAELEELNRGDDARVTRALIWSLSKAEPQQALPKLEAFLRDGDEALRLEALRSLISLKTPAAMALVLERLREDASGELRREAATLLALAGAGDQELIPALARAAEVDESPAVRRAAIDGLGVVSNPAALAALETLKKAGRSPEDRLRADDLLKRMAIINEAGGADLTEAFGPAETEKTQEAERPR